MSTLTNFYINSDDKDVIVNQLKSLANISDVEIGDYPEDLYDNYLFDETAMPTYLAIAGTTPHWITISHNSFNNLTDWCKMISQELNTKVIVTLAQSVSDAYYFSMYDRGQKIREIQVCYSDDSKPLNFGQKFEFEDEHPGKKQELNGEINYYFGFEEIEEYCKRFGLIIDINYTMVEWTILKSGIRPKTINDFLQSEFKKTKKPWWKFW